MSLTVVGSVALDTVETPAGKNVDGLGGAATYFALASANFTETHLVGVVGEDFPEPHIQLLESKGINLDGLERAKGHTFRWTGKYHDDINERDTLETHLNVFEHFHPKVPARASEAPFLFLGNIQPTLQLEVLEQTKHAFVALDTMNLWINIARDELLAVLKRVDCLIINDQEAKMLTERGDVRKAADDIRNLGPRIVVVKKGEHGVLLFGADQEIFALPAMPLKNVIDPTGAGDSFAGGFMGYLARKNETTFAALRQAIVYGSVCASFTCEAFGPDRLAQVDESQIEQRFKEFQALTAF